MKFFANENVFEPIIAYLRDLGHDILSIRDSGLSGITDDEVYRRACDEKRVIVAMDKDFSRTFRFPPEGCGGIIVLKLYKLSIEETLEYFKEYFANLKAEDIVDNLVTVTKEGVRIRRSV